MKQFLGKEFYAEDLEGIAPRLWVMTTPSSANINPLHRQRVKGREIIVTEEPRLHLVWIHDRIFIKPLPRYLLSHAFWEIYLSETATGFLRTYRYLIRHESDFNSAQQEHLSLIPKEVDWASFCRFTSELDYIRDSDVSGRYCYGELTLTRLNFYAPLFLRKFHFEQVQGQYGDFFGRLYGPILVAFAVVSTILNAMQVELAVEQLVAVHWASVWSVCRWFSIISLLGAAVISAWFIFLWLWIFLDEWIYTARCRWEKRRGNHGRSKC
ncbi:hypothetical protein K469DRAFT_724399 [Zopfia rhizophila CBS 207.26]|uniref:Uncharacterized protein n=1 Tax=Zopfia rhizophila CBS 207.26 TaxID=1314779 RepID=A0A6A6D730_9PEZI|nr:hypothetical protein K469DRAFT_724399 [Zopfia rhizophila CBS 207.26]